MAKKKKSSSNWLRQEINPKLSYVFILLLFLLCILVAYTYSIPSVGIPIESQIETNIQNFLLSLTPAPKEIKPTSIKVVGTPLPNPTQMALLRARYGNTWPTVKPTFTPIEQLPSENFNDLEIYQEGLIPGKIIPQITKSISDPKEIDKLYGDIQNLPFWPQGAEYSCGREPVNGYIYKLKFFTKSGSFVYAELDPNGCPGVTFAGEYVPRMAMNPQGNNLIEDLQQALNLSKQEFYSY